MVMGFRGTMSDPQTSQMSALAWVARAGATRVTNGPKPSRLASHALAGRIHHHAAAETLRLAGGPKVGFPARETMPGSIPPVRCLAIKIRTAPHTQLKGRWKSGAIASRTTSGPRTSTRYRPRAGQPVWVVGFARREARTTRHGDERRAERIVLRVGQEAGRPRFGSRPCSLMSKSCEIRWQCFCSDSRH